MNFAPHSGTQELQ